MDEKLFEEMKGKSREERTAFFREYMASKEPLSSDELEAVNGGAGFTPGTNPTSTVPWQGSYWSSWGFVCESERCRIRC